MMYEYFVFILAAFHRTPHDSAQESVSPIRLVLRGNDNLAMNKQQGW
jgi:hypothetical protein